MTLPKWPKMRKRSEIELPERPPIWLGDKSNGEYFRFATRREKKLEKFIMQKADENARKVGMPRRDFLASAMGMATSLWCINYATACGSSDDSSGSSGAGGSSGSGGVGTGGGAPGGAAGAAGGGGDGPNPDLCAGYQVTPEMMYDPALACGALSGSEFIFDIQTHHFEPGGEWTIRNPTYAQILQFMVGTADYGFDRYAEIMFLESDTTMAVLSTWPGALCTDAADELFGMGPGTAPCGLPMSNEGAAQSRDIINQIANSQRILNHTMVLPNDPAGVEFQKEIMTRIACTTGVSAWKLYPPWGPVGQGYWLTDDIAVQIIEHGRSLGIKTFCAHKGLPILGFDPTRQSPQDVGTVAAMFPDTNFIVYHAGICSGLNENSSSFLCGPQEYGPYVEGNTIGVDALITSMRANGIQPNTNVYAELGSSWSLVMNDPVQAAHYLGKLMLHVGEDNICWGTDAMVGGTPQDQIIMMRLADIPQSMQDAHGYPALTPERKAKILGLNAARVYGVDVAAQRCAIDAGQLAQFKEALDSEIGAYRFAMREPMGPRTPEEYFHHGKWNIAHGVPG